MWHGRLGSRRCHERGCSSWKRFARPCSCLSVWGLSPVLHRHALPGCHMQPKGRAMKRLKYNRRFVNVVVGFGKKR